MYNVVIIISQYFPDLTNTHPSVYMQTILWKSGQIYFSNICCGAFFLGFHIYFTIANNIMQITFLQISKIVDLIFKLIKSFHWSL